MSTITTNELRRALAPYRPDPRAFRSGVERRLAEREREWGPGSRADVRRRAAALLPLELLGGAGGATAGQGASALAALALPAVSVAMLVLAFLAGLRAALSGLRAEADARRPAPAPAPADAERDLLVAAWWRAHRVPAAAVLLALAGLAVARPLEAVVGVLLVSIAAVALRVAQLARAGAATRARLGAFTSAFLGGLLGLALLPEVLLGPRLDVGARLAGEGFPAYGAFGVLLWGLVACDLAGRWSPRWTRARRLSAALVPSALLLAFLAALEGRALPAGPERLGRLVERAAPPLDDAVAWLRLGRIGSALTSLDARGATPAPAARRAVEAGWSERPPRAPLFGPGFDEQALAGAARLDALPPGLWEALAAEPRSRALAAGTAALVSAEHAALRVRALARAGLEPAERDRLAQSLRAAWPAPSAPRALEEMSATIELARLLGLPPAPELERDVHAALREHWTGGGDERGAAAFATRAGTGPGELGYPQYLPPTSAALELMRAYGAPAELDLRRLRRFLAGAATPSLVEVLAPPGLPLLTIQPARHEAAAALLALDALVPAPPRTWIGERVLLGAALLVALCLLATLAGGQSVKAS